MLLNQYTLGLESSSAPRYRRMLEFVATEFDGIGGGNRESTGNPLRHAPKDRHASAQVPWTYATKQLPIS